MCLPPQFLCPPSPFPPPPCLLLFLLSLIRHALFLPCLSLMCGKGETASLPLLPLGSKHQRLNYQLFCINLPLLGSTHGLNHWGLPAAHEACRRPAQPPSAALGLYTVWEAESCPKGLELVGGFTGLL